jgi:D-threo-aldose 1-dehydrogenase
VFDFSYDGVMRSVEESLARLGLDRIDILYIHDPDDHYDQACDGAFAALDRLRRSGSVGAIGVGMNQHQMLARFAAAAPFDCLLLAGRYSLLDQGALDDLLPLCAGRGIAVVAGGVYNSGILANPRSGATYDYEAADAGRLERAQRLQRLCADHGIDLKAAAIRFVLAHPAVTATVIGARSPQEIAASVAAAEQPIPADFWRAVRRAALVDDRAPLPGYPA